MDLQRQYVGSAVMTPKRFRSRNQRGSTLIELMIAAAVLAISMAGLALMFCTAATSTNRTKVDSNSTLVAKLILEQIAAQDPSSANTISIQDCAGTTWTVNTTGGASPNGSGANLNNSSSSPFYGGVDFTQDYSSVTTGYKMKYQDCGAVNGQGGYTTYDVRWNVIALSADSTGAVRTKLVTVAAKQSGVSSSMLGSSYFAFPVNLRAIGGPIQ